MQEIHPLTRPGLWEWHQPPNHRPGTPPPSSPEYLSFLICSSLTDSSRSISLCAFSTSLRFAVSHKGPDVDLFARAPLHRALELDFLHCSKQLLVVGVRCEGVAVSRHQACLQEHFSHEARCGEVLHWIGRAREARLFTGAHEDGNLRRFTIICFAFSASLYQARACETYTKYTFMTHGALHVRNFTRP